MKFGVEIEQLKHDEGKTYTLMRRNDGGALNNHLVGIGSLEGDTLSVEWIEVRDAFRSGLRLDVEGPYKAFCYVTTRKKDETIKGPHGERSYDNVRATLHVCLWDGSAWGCDVVQ